MEVLNLGQQSYKETWCLQKELVQKRLQDEILDTLILVEHEPVYTVGRGGQVSLLNTKGIPIIEVERGGKTTFHGPGQIVGYPIFKLKHRDIRLYLKSLENVLITILKKTTGLIAEPYPSQLKLEPGQLQTGVWIENRKIASIGIAVKHWVSYHGFALNLSTDLSYFEAINPCGFRGSIMTSVEKELGQHPEKLREKIENAILDKFTGLET